MTTSLRSSRKVIAIYWLSRMCLEKMLTNTLLKSSTGEDPRFPEPIWTSEVGYMTLNITFYEKKLVPLQKLTVLSNSSLQLHPKSMYHLDSRKSVPLRRENQWSLRFHSLVTPNRPLSGSEMAWRSRDVTTSRKWPIATPSWPLRRLLKKTMVHTGWLWRMNSELTPLSSRSKSMVSLASYWAFLI